MTWRMGEKLPIRLRDRMRNRGRGLHGLEGWSQTLAASRRRSSRGGLGALARVGRLVSAAMAAW